MNKEYIYVIQYYHKDCKSRKGLDLQTLGLTEKKIGYTKDLKERKKALNSTKMTIGCLYSSRMGSR